MPFQSPFPPVHIPKCNVLSYLYPADEPPSTTPIWIDASDSREHLTPKKLLQWVKRVATGLDKLGVELGQPVVIYTPNHIFVPVAYLSIAGSGRIFSGANPSYTVPELAYQLSDTQASILWTHPDLLLPALKAAQRAGLPRDRIFLFSDKPNAETNGIHDWRNMLGSEEESSQYTWNAMLGEESINTVATINYSSGTTGLPKGVCVSHHNLVANAIQAMHIDYAYEEGGVDGRSPEKWVGFLPLYHAFGQLYACLLAIKQQVPIYIMRSFSLEAYLQAIQDHKATNLQVAPPIMVLLAKRPEVSKYDLSSLKHIICGAAPLAGSLQNEVAKRLNVRIGQGWGMTELVCKAIACPHRFEDRTGSIGMLVPNCECKLLGENGDEVSHGEPGEIFVRGPNVCLGYWRNETASKEAISTEGWLKTGDVAVAKDNLFWIVDRKKELIKVKGSQVAPAELEAALLENDDIADAAVVGVTLHGEECPRAYIALKEHAKGKIKPKNVQDWLSTRVAKHKRLTGGVAFVDVVPKSPSGKILRKIMRDWAKRDTPQLEKQVRARL